MSLASFLTSTASLQRQGGGPSASGGTISGPFQVVTGFGALACAIWPRNTGNPVVQSQSAIRGDFVVAFNVNPTAYPGDKLVVGSQAYLVNGSMPYACPILTIGTLYLIYADLWTRN